MSISLESSLKTCKVDQAWANKVQSDRFLNPDNMVCPIWNGFDLTGRLVSPDSFYTKSAGCNSAVDRVLVENDQRPQYAEYINLSASGIDASIYGDFSNNMPWTESGATNADLRNINNITGNFGLAFDASVYPSCGTYPYNQGMAQVTAEEAGAVAAAAGAPATSEGFKHREVQPIQHQRVNEGYKQVPRHAAPQRAAPQAPKRSSPRTASQSASTQKHTQENFRQPAARSSPIQHRPVQNREAFKNRAPAARSPVQNSREAFKNTAPAVRSPALNSRESFKNRAPTQTQTQKMRENFVNNRNQARMNAPLQRGAQRPNSEGFRNRSPESKPNTYPQVQQKSSENFRQQGALQNGFINNDSRRYSGF